jgi:hypothetical protein
MLAGNGVRLVEKDCFPDATQSVEDKAPGGLTGAKALERNPEVFDLAVAPDQTRRARASAGRVRVLVRVHASNAI